MNIIKRNGEEKLFDTSKIKNAILKANASMPESNKIDETLASKIASDIEQYAITNNLRMTVEEVQDLVETKLMENNAHKLAQAYIRYRYDRFLKRKQNTIDDNIMSMLNMTNKEVMEENSNKNPKLNSTLRDYIAGDVSKDLMRRYVLSKDILDAHDNGLIHFHDMDYAIGRLNNCGLVNLEDMLQNGTVISETMIEKPNSFHVACNVATQIIAQVASSQYGGQSITLSHLAPFVDVSRKRIRREVTEEYFELSKDIENSNKIISEITEKRLKDEIRRSVQTIQYQINTLMTTNGLR